MTHPEAFHIFKANVFNKIHAAVPQVDNAWLDSHNSRLSLFWNCGEGPDTAADTMIAFAKANFSATYAGREKSPLQLAISHRRM